MKFKKGFMDKQGLCKKICYWWLVMRGTCKNGRVDIVE